MSLSCGSWNWNSQCSWMQHMSQFFKRSWTKTRFDFTFLTLRVVNLREVLLELRAVFFVSLWCGFIGLALSECSGGLSLQKPGPDTKKELQSLGWCPLPHIHQDRAFSGCSYQDYHLVYVPRHRGGAASLTSFTRFCAATLDRTKLCKAFSLQGRYIVLLTLYWLYAQVCIATPISGLQVAWQPIDLVDCCR